MTPGQLLEGLRAKGTQEHACQGGDHCGCPCPDPVAYKGTWTGQGGPSDIFFCRGHWEGDACKMWEGLVVDVVEIQGV